TLASLGGGGTSVFAKFSGVDGTHLWSRTPISGTSNEARAVAVDQNGNVVFAGTSGSGGYDVGGGALGGTDSPNVYVAKYSPTGSFVWAKVLGSTTPLYGTSVGGVATTAAGDVVVAGQFSNPINFGGGPLTKYSGFQDTFVARFAAADGAHVWSKNFPNLYNDWATSVAVDGQDNVVFVGNFSGTINFGGGSLTVSGSQNFDYDVYVAKLSPTGAYLWAKSFGDPNPQGAGRVAVDANRNVYVTGYFAGSVNFGGGALTSAGSNDVFITSLAP